MKRRTVLSTTFAVLTLLQFGASALLNGDANSIIADLLDTDIDNVQEVVNQFKFWSNVTSDKITVIQHKSDGTTYNFNLSQPEDTQNLDIDWSQKIVILIHGWNGSGELVWIQRVITKYHNEGVENTLVISWPILADTGYLAAAGATKNVGELVGKWLFTNLLMGNLTLLPDIHIVGHSLGAHIAGFVGQAIIELSDGKKLGRITGLDPAAPLFENNPFSIGKLTKNDAIEVEAYHTNKGIFGFLGPIGKQDFYINLGGPIQTQCLSQILPVELVLCSHYLSCVFFAESIGTTKYVSKKYSTDISYSTQECSQSETVIMGENNNGTNLEGTFYGDANDFVVKPPY